MDEEAAVTRYRTFVADPPWRYQNTSSCGEPSTCFTSPQHVIGRLSQHVPVVSDCRA